MRFLSVAERELRAGARQKATHRLRWITAGVFFALLLWLIWVFNGFRAPQIFHAFSAITFFYCLMIGTARTADCLSSEKREGTMGLVLFFSAGVMGAAAIISVLGGATKISRNWVEGMVIFSPLYTLISADGNRGMFGPNHYWWSLLAVGVVSLLFLALATWRVSNSWRDRASGRREWTKLTLLSRWRDRGDAGRIALRRRLLGINPFYWLGGRGRVSAPVFMLLMLVIVPITSYVGGPYFASKMRVGAASPMLGQLFAWLWAGLM